MSKSVGIVAEYNPFHTGHRYQIDFLKGEGFDTVVVAMSGSRVQRGSLALLNKHTRAKMALENGVSLVAEIPYPFSDGEYYDLETKDRDRLILRKDYC